jgi:hypothetical protein
MNLGQKPTFMTDSNELPNPQEEIEAFLKGKPISAEFLTQLSTRVEALVKGLKASTKDLHRPGAGSPKQSH